MIDLIDVGVVVGGSLIVLGVAMVSAAAACVVAGLELLALSLAAARRGGAGKHGPTDG